MCGIVGYNGNKEAAPILLEGLQSWNIEDMTLPDLLYATALEDTEIVKAKGR
jgi:glucosamine--fructose-6-phosphate aminotransferase (isomerizing)